MNTFSQDFLSGKRIAIAGASRSGKKFGNIACKELKARGYDVFLVHREAREIDGERCYPNLSALRGKVDVVLLSVPPSEAGKLMREAAESGIRRVWLQRGAENQELIDLGHESGLDLVSGKCILMYASPVRGFHWFHRAVVRLMGQL